MFQANPSSTVTPSPRRIPEPYLRAEIAAFPLTSEESFRLSLLEINPSLGETDTDKTRKLWRACENLFAPHTGWSLDRLIAARDLGWFGKRDGPLPESVPMHAYLRALARTHLVPRAGATEIEESTELSALDAVDHYRWLTIALPEDLLLAALNVEPPPTNVDIDPPLLVRRLLDSGVAEIHQHIGSSMSFTLLWVSALAAIVRPTVTENELASAGAPLSDGKHLVRWLLAAAVARCALAEHLIRGGDNFKTFLNSAFLEDCAENNYESNNSSCCCGRNYSAWTPRRRETLIAVFNALAFGDDTLLPEIGPLRDLYADIHPTALTLNDALLENIDDAYQRCDPIAVRLDLCGENVGERWLLRKSLAYLDNDDRQHETDDTYFAAIFWQYTRIRCLYYRTVVERPLTGGLQWFIRFYDRIGKLSEPLYPILPQIAYRVDGDKHRIKALEIRTGMQNTAIEAGEHLLTFLKSWQRVLNDTRGSAFEPEMGVICLFNKSRDVDSAWLKGVPPAYGAQTYAEPHRKNGCKHMERGRYISYFIAQARKARALGELIQAVPSSLWLIRGLDVATDELGIPTWIFAPIFRHILDEAARVSAMNDAGPPLRVTAHVGEDFRHLLEGLRRIYEQIHYILGNTTGRLGHAVALGVDPQTWAESVGSILMPAEERLWDLVWEWRLYSQYRLKPEYAAIAPPGRVATITNQIRFLSEHVFGTSHYRLEELAELHHVLHRFLVPPITRNPMVEGRFDTFQRAARDVRSLGKHQELVHWPQRVGQILETYIDDDACFHRGQKLIDIPICSGEVAALTAVQHALRRGIGQNGIVIEVNPSSNLLIGDLLDLRNHPILRLHPPVPDPDGPPPVAIAVGSDDPLTFSTQLLREYTLLHHAACSAGYPERSVQDWLETIRRTGMDARFTRAWKPNAEEKTKELVRDLSRYLHKPGYSSF